MVKNKHHYKRIMRGNVGKFLILAENVCRLECNCGWNLWIGGEDKKDLKEIKQFLRNLK